jgi:hypothetical protein
MVVRCNLCGCGNALARPRQAFRAAARLAR